MSSTTAEVASIKKEFATLSKSMEAIPKANDDDKFQDVMSVSLFLFVYFRFSFFSDGTGQAGNLEKLVLAIF